MAPLKRFQSKIVEKPASGYGYGLLLVIFNVVITAFFWWQLPPQIPLFYSLPYGTSQLATKIWFFILPILSVLIWVSYFLLSKIKTNTKIYTQILMWLHFTSLVLVTIALLHIVLVVL